LLNDRSDGACCSQPPAHRRDPAIGRQLEGREFGVSVQSNPVHNRADHPSVNPAWRRDLAVVLRRYGFLGLDHDGSSVSSSLSITNAALENIPPSAGGLSVIIVDRGAKLDGLRVRDEVEGGFLYKPRASWFEKRVPFYRCLSPHLSFSGKSLIPILSTRRGRTVVGWWDHNGRRHLVIGLKIVEEIVRYTQGDPRKVVTAKDKTLWGFGHERPAYLFEDNIVPKHELVPWADRLGFLLTRLLSEASGLPLIEPLPGGAKGAVLLTGDDDQAFLEKYDEQLGLLGDFPMSYIMLPHTKHTAQTLAAMPSNIEFGTHVDALPDPESYAAVCRDQTDAVRQLTGKPARTVRNHGHLNRGYWGHLGAWEECGLTLDLNIRGLDGTCSTGSYLPFRLLRQDGSWSSHNSLFSTFSDSMYYLQKWAPSKQIECVTGLADQISFSNPGIIVINLHPQNVSDFHDLHRAVVKLGRQNGWVALGAESFVDWLAAMESVSLVDTGSGFELRSSGRVEGLAYYWPGRRDSERPIVLAGWQGRVSI
jgi:hypothetical protein